MLCRMLSLTAAGVLALSGIASATLETTSDAAKASRRAFARTGESTAASSRQGQSRPGKRRFGRCVRSCDAKSVAAGPHLVAGVEDVDGDAVPDILVEEELGEDLLVFSGVDGVLLDSVKPSSREHEWLLARVLSGRGRVDGDVVVGDVDGDAMSDIVAGEWHEGRLLVFSGADGVLLHALTMPGEAAESANGNPGIERSLATAPCQIREAYVKSGEWRTLASLWNVSATARFQAPKGATIKVRYGIGWFGWDSQKKTLDGITVRELTVSKTASLSRARIQMKVPASRYVTWTYCGY